jgi:hypothetical protein
MHGRSARSFTRAVLGVGIASALVAAALAIPAVAAPSAACAVCGKNLIKNPGAEAGAGVTAVGAFGAVPGWTNVAGQFGAASYTFPNGWYSTASKGSPKRGKNYFFGGTTAEAASARATIGMQTIKLPAAAAGRKATLTGWLGNYGTGPVANTTQVRAQFTDASGKVLGALRIGPDTTISSTDMALRSRSAKIPAGATQVVIVVTSARADRTPLPTHSKRMPSATRTRAAASARGAARASTAVAVAGTTRTTAHQSGYANSSAPPPACTAARKSA